ncbi:MAG: deoxyribodipyrimidine photo-lyase, partial [Bacteroidota bacterium]
MEPPVFHVVWFKRDLRVRDHRPLWEAAQRGRVLPLYIVEPSVVQAADYEARHWAFIRESLEDLRADLAGLGQPLVVRVGEAVEVFQRLYAAAGRFHLWAHQETGTALTYARDRAVQAWVHEQGLTFTEYPQRGVVRALRDRDTWAAQFDAYMTAPEARVPEAMPRLPNVRLGPLPTGADLGLSPTVLAARQPGGAAAGQDTLRTFLAERGADYHRKLSSPLTAPDHCSRLSPHLAWGTLSLRQVIQAARQQRQAVRSWPPARRGGWPRALAAFESRLHWHGHFMQKLESDPRIETESFVTTYDGVRTHDAARFEAWQAGCTGYPMVDAAMRSLTATGYLNFRMRALLVSFAAYDLWLDWRSFHHVLARRWLDYEPGIHLSQVQMQSGTSGINTLRIYNPTKQAQDHDPEGEFIRRWIPELEGVPKAFIHTPWLMTKAVQQVSGCRLGATYPMPVVDHAQAARQAKARITQVRAWPETQAQAAAVLDKHGSRRGKRRAQARHRPPPRPRGDVDQQSLPL